VPYGVNMGETVVLPYLREMGLAQLDTLIISHPDLDHSAGASDIVSALKVDRLRYGGTGPVGLAGRPCVAGEAWRWPEGAVFQFLSPAHESTSSSNNSSCVLQVEVGDYRFLLPGDVESDRERVIARYWGDALHSDWLLAAHHGSKTSSSPTLLKRIRPGTVVISSGYANRFGHPHPRVLQQLDSRGAMVWSTANSGALTFEITPGEAVRVRPHRSVSPRYWM
jgi:competence protein ComEC